MITICRLFGISYGPDREKLSTTEIALRLYPALIHGGPDAWGWMAWDGFGDIEHFKMPGMATSDRSERLQNLLIPEEVAWFAGHLRYATHGKPEQNANNHPILHRNIIGIHNGVLRNHDSVLKITGRADPKAIVDSEAIFAAVNKWGPGKGLSKINGNMVSVFADYRRPHLLYMARSYGRPVVLGWTDQGNLIWASEEQALRELEPEISFTHTSRVQENRLLTIMDGEIVARKFFSPPRPKPYKPQKPVARPTSTFDNDLIGLDATVDPFVTRMANRAVARGSIMFPKDEDDIDPKAEPGQLCYYRGELMTYLEYQDAVQREFD